MSLHSDKQDRTTLLSSSLPCCWKSNRAFYWREGESLVLPIEEGNLSTTLILLLVTSWVLGFRHGIDWDHIAAIADIVSGQPRPWQAIRYGSMYALGHSLIIFGVGLVAILLGLNLPMWIDGLMEHIVGATLLLLGLWV